mmetsp:Transcript_11036/g.15292  ORF Transcript_11036/g.15292 Transcript_11036/m.15292 type:complete len:175 (-) Transcript_11036:46-570(-)
MYYRGAAAAIIVFERGSRVSFIKAKAWVEELQSSISVNDHKVVLLLACNKCDETSGRSTVLSSIEDSKEERNIAWKEVRAFAAKKRLFLFECSAKTGYNIKTIFETIANALAKNFAISENKLFSIGSKSSKNSFARSWGSRYCDREHGLRYYKRKDSSSELHDRFVPCKGCCYT